MLRKCTFCLAFFVCLTAQAEETLRGVERKIQKAWGSVGSVVADVQMESYIPAGPQALKMTGTGILEYMKAEPSPKYRQRVEMSIPEPVPMQAVFEFLFDGSNLYLINEIGDQQTIAQADTASFGSGALPPGGSALIQALRAELALTPLPEQDIDGKSMYVLEGRRRATGGGDPVQRAIFYIDKENGIQRRAEFYTADNTLHTKIDYLNLKLNLQMDPQHFVYDGPKPPAPSPEDENSSAPAVQVP